MNSLRRLVRKRTVGAMLVMWLVSQAMPGQQKDEASLLIKRALDLSDLRQLTTAYHLQAEVTLRTSANKSLNGSYRVRWISAEKWQDELEMPGFRQTRIVTGSELWIDRTLPYEPIQVWAVTEALDIHSLLNPPPNSVVGKARRKKDGGALLQCVEIRGKSPSTSEACFSESSGELARIRRTTGLRCIYSDYAAWGSKSYARTIRAFENDTPVAEIRITELGALSPTDPDWPPASVQAKRFGWCNDIIPAEAVQKTPPTYPPAAKQAHLSGTVAVYGVVALNGKLRDVRVVESPGPEFDAATTTALHKWVFQPAMCNGAPVESEFVTTVHYALNY